jgi:hypothetical protein
MLVDIERMDEIAKMICYRHRLLKTQLFLHTRMVAISDARFHFYLMCVDEGIRVCEIQRYCERWGYPVTHAAIIHGINKIRKYEQQMIDKGLYNSVRNFSRAQRAKERRLRKKLRNEKQHENQPQP